MVNLFYLINFKKGIMYYLSAFSESFFFKTKDILFLLAPCEIISIFILLFDNISKTLFKMSDDFSTFN